MGRGKVREQVGKWWGGLKKGQGGKYMRDEKKAGLWGRGKRGGHRDTQTAGHARKGMGRGKEREQVGKWWEVVKKGQA